MKTHPSRVLVAGSSGLDNSASVLECIDIIRQISGRRLLWSHQEQERKEDHICDITNLPRLRHDHPEWQLGGSLIRIGQDTWKVVSDA